MGDKSNRVNIAEQLSHIVSIEEIVIESVAEMVNKPKKDVEEFYKNSESYKKLYNINSDYYLNDINIIVAEFARECADIKGWKIY